MLTRDEKTGGLRGEDSKRSEEFSAGSEPMRSIDWRLELHRAKTPHLEQASATVALKYSTRVGRDCAHGATPRESEVAVTSGLAKAGPRVQIPALAFAALMRAPGFLGRFAPGQQSPRKLGLSW